MSYDLLAPIIRYALHALATMLVASGWFDEGMTEAFVGLGINAGAFLWYVLERAWKKKVPADPDYSAGV
jgi:hypothetical protein